MTKFSIALALGLLSGAANAQPPLRVRGLKPDAGHANDLKAVPLKSRSTRSHLLVQFDHHPSKRELDNLAKRDVSVLSYVPDFAFFVSVREGSSLDGLGILRALRLHPEEKISALLEGSARPIGAVVEFYSDVDRADARAIVADTGLENLENPDLVPNHILVRGSREQLFTLANSDEVSYIFPASEDLLRGNPVHACAGALTTQGPVQQAVPLVGDGWDGPGLGSANLNYCLREPNRTASRRRSRDADRERFFAMEQIRAGHFFSER